MRILMFFLFSCFFSLGQKDFPDLVMNCQYSKFLDNGNHVKEAIQEYENWLINDGLLENNTPQSYMNMLSSLAVKTSTTQFKSLNQFLYKNRVNYKDIKDSGDCSRKLELEMPDSFQDKLDRFKIITTSIQFNSEPHLIFSKLEDLFELDDFKYDFYKMELFTVMSLMSFTEGIKPMKYDLKISKGDNNENCESLRVLINQESLIIIEKTGKTIEIDEFKIQLIKHFQENKETACVILTASKKAKYATYESVTITLREALLEVRNIASSARFNKSFNNLNEDQIDEIRKMYPQRILEQDFEE